MLDDSESNENQAGTLPPVENIFFTYLYSGSKTPLHFQRFAKSTSVSNFDSCIALLLLLLILFCLLLFCF